MKYSFQCYIKTDNDGIRNAVQQLIPDRDDSRIWDVQYSCVDTVDEDGKVFICNINFHMESDRNGITTSVKGLTGVINACNRGSYVKEYKCFHDEAINGVPPRKCEQETILRKG